MRLIGSVQVLPASSLASSIPDMVVSTVCRLPVTKMFAPNPSTDDNSRYTGQGSSSEHVEPRASASSGGQTLLDFLKFLGLQSQQGEREHKRGQDRDEEGPHGVLHCTRCALQ